jgi:hypothetical protein
VTGQIRKARLLAAASLALLAAGCAGGGDDEETPSRAASLASQSADAPACPGTWKAGWQELANRIDAAVYCPSWMPDPLTGELGGESHGVESVKHDGSYLQSFIYFERGIGEVHVNLRAYPGRTDIPSCDGRPCFSDLNGRKRIAGLDIDVYTANKGVDLWHVLYAWERDGSLYTISQHVVPDLGQTYGQVVKNLDRMVRSFDLIEPKKS